MADSTNEFPENVNTLSAEDGTTWVEIASSGTEDESQLIKGFLQAEGIPAEIENVKFTMEPINFGTMGDIRIYVPAEHEQQAMALLKSREQQYERLDEDAETVVTDEGPAEIDDTARTENDDGTAT